MFPVISDKQTTKAAASIRADRRFPWYGVWSKRFQPASGAFLSRCMHAPPTQTTMQIQYFLFQKNKVVSRVGALVPQPCSSHEKEQLCRSAAPSPSGEIAISQSAFAVELDADSELPRGYELISLKSLLGLVDEDHFRCWGKASHLLHWRRRNRFCGSCGAKTVEHPHEQALVCPDCKAHHYPVISPCIIVLIHRPREILLARSNRFRINMYSTLAGFIEAGESAEEALHREVYEEVGVRVGDVRYFKSQPWPFPGQLMLGFFARYISGDIDIDRREISDARWYPLDGLPEIPGPKTIAGQLIRHHLRSNF